MRTWNRFRFWLSRPRLDEELADEIQAHREMLEEQFRREGMSPAEAHDAAAREFGGDLRAREQSREEWGFRWLDALGRDLRFAFRVLRRQPTLVAAAVLTVGLGVGANTAVLSVLQNVLLNPLGLRDASRVMVATVRLDSLHMSQAPTSGVEYRELQGMADAFAAVAAAEGRTWTLQAQGEAARLPGAAVTPDYFRVFGQTPFLGRFFAAEDRYAAVLSYGFWRTRFGGDRSVVGRKLLLDGHPHVIVGIAPEGFHSRAETQAWTPLVLEPDRLRNRGDNMTLALYARLRDGVGPQRAADRVNRYVAGLQEREIAKFGYHIDLEPLSLHVAGDLGRPLWLLWAAALVVLCAGCANVASLLLSRVAGRRREMAVRLSLGGTRLQILRQLMVESAVLGTLAGAFGVLTAALALPFLKRFSIPDRNLLETVVLDWRLMAYAMALSLLCGLLFGLAPALQLLRGSQTGALQRAGRRRFQDVFVAAQVTAAVVLLIGTGLLLRSFWALQQVRPGFDPHHVSTACLMKPGQDPGFLDRLETALAAGPGVQSAALAYPLPFSGGGLTSMFTIQGRHRQPGEPEWHGEAYFVSAGFFETLRIPIVRGRGIARTDGAPAPLICVIDTHLARRFFSGQDPIGQEIGMYQGRARIVGVAAEIRGTTLEGESRPVVYYSLPQVPVFDQAGVVVRSPLPAGSFIRQAVRRASAAAPVFDQRSMDDRIAESTGIRRAVTSLVCAFASLCLLLAAVGLNGVVSQMVGERRPEIGLRMALGARPVQILGQFLTSGLVAGLVGVLAGLGICAYAQRWLGTLLYEIKEFDPPSFVAAGAGVLFTLLLAILWPARQAAHTDPQSVLRYE